MSTATHPPNRLAHEKSPYLLQHAHNPVDWYPWGEAAFARARAEDKPIFLSIGYSTCHWCHVMERESFEDVQVAALLREHFVAIKVDREERPDVDRIYMTAMQAMGQGGGWPLNVFLAPSLEPFYGGTYFPPTTRHGRTGMRELLPQVAQAWRTQRGPIVETGERVRELLGTLSRSDREPEALEQLERGCLEWLERAHDATHGGFGNAPKFPSPGNLTFLFREYDRESRAHALAMAVGQLDAMRRGGIHDHVGGGFHRYSTDREWLVPHFEKMLYDQALIADNLLDAFAATGDPRHADTARGVFAYVARDLTSPEGAFFSAEDADAEGEEGRFHVWTPTQLAAALGPDDADLVARYHGVTASGNFEHGTSILHEARPVPDDVAPRLAAARAKLLAARETRVRPHLDDKVLTAWNALMIAALARGASELGEPGLAQRAIRAAEFVWQHLRTPDGTLLRRWRGGEAAGAGQLDDHAYYAHACLELYAATLDPRWLERSLAVTDTLLAAFWDEADGACFESPAGDASVLVRMKDGFDGAELAGNSVAARVLVRLAHLTARADLLEKSERIVAFHARRLAGNAFAMPLMLVAMREWASPGRHVVIAGEAEAADTRALLDAAASHTRASDRVLLLTPATRDALARLAPFTASLVPQGGVATAYVCVDRACRLPSPDPATLAAQLASD